MLEDGAKILHDSLGLRGGVACNYLVGCRINRDLAGDENESVCTDRLRIMSDGPGCLSC